MLFATVACSCGTSCCGGGQSVPQKKGDVVIAYDDPYVKKVLGFFQANQGYVIAYQELAAAEGETPDYNQLAGKACIAVLKDEAIAEKLKAAGWIETPDWTDAQKKTNEGLFHFIVLTSPANTESGKKAAKYLTDWLVGDGTYDATVTTVSGGCG
jgi:hypothetical protein